MSKSERPGTRIAVSIGDSATPVADQVRAAVEAGADIVELRVDLMGNADTAERYLRAVSRADSAPPAPLILTVRSAGEGGAWTGDETERAALIERLARHAPAYVDIELAAWERSEALRNRFARARQAGKNAEHAGASAPAARESRLIVSYHNLKMTPENLDEILERLAATSADVIKAVFTARDSTDACRVLAALKARSRDRAIIALAMGEAGLITRVLAGKFGAFLTFAATTPTAATAPGQPTLSELHDLYRWKQVGSATRVFGVVGWPVAHSLGPRIHNAAMGAGAIDGVYLPLPVAPRYADFAAFMDFIAGNAWLDVFGLSVTLPHKQHALRWLDERGDHVSDRARRYGAVNTLTRIADGGWRGDNTDGLGAVRALETIPEFSDGGLSGRSVDVLGAGGAARGVVSALLECGCRVTVYNRSPQRASSLAGELDCAWQPWESRRNCSADILINCTSVGMTPATEASPMADIELSPAAVVMDTIYTPPRTRLLREAAGRGCRVVSGSEMFIGQAGAQYESWHARTAPVSVLRTALASALGRGNV